MCLSSVTINQKRKVYDVFCRKAFNSHAWEVPLISVCIVLAPAPAVFTVSFPSSPKALCRFTSWLMLHSHYPESCCRLCRVFILFLSHSLSHLSFLPTLCYCFCRFVFPFSCQLSRTTEEFRFDKDKTRHLDIVKQNGDWNGSLIMKYSKSFFSFYHLEDKTLCTCKRLRWIYRLVEHTDMTHTYS